ncbi:hypothetical protein P4O66_001678 [Electrophorus voltai]|uniref:Transposase Tc1-like domain-containing protein n=1 Tax=Electrophorus voltai TaxID=2609070 RepID=A0AAD8Z5F7_9TELE|nr:hypothetical protein P4O66_001678 [Electrophorus voltai]
MHNVKGTQGIGTKQLCNLKKPLVSEANQQKWLQFAMEHKDWTLEQWKKVMWSDEYRFTLFQSDGRIRCNMLRSFQRQELGIQSEILPNGEIIDTHAHTQRRRGNESQQTTLCKGQMDMLGVMLALFNFETTFPCNVKAKETKWKHPAPEQPTTVASLRFHNGEVRLPSSVASMCERVLVSCFRAASPAAITLR